jgi:hypothetical protein
MTKIVYLIVPVAWITMTLGLVQAQSLTSRNPRRAGTIARSALPSNTSSTALNIETMTALVDGIPGLQEETRRELLIFKPVPGEKNARVAEFTTPNGLRIRAFTNGPNSIRFTSTEPSANFAAININGAGAVGTTSLGAGAKIDSISGALRKLGDALGLLSGAGNLKCETTVTVTIDSNGITKTSIVSVCEKPKP